MKLVGKSSSYSTVFFQVGVYSLGLEIHDINELLLFFSIYLISTSTPLFSILPFGSPIQFFHDLPQNLYISKQAHTEDSQIQAE